MHLIILNIMHMEIRNLKEQTFHSLINIHFHLTIQKKNAKFCWKGTAYLGKELVEKEFINFECIHFNTIQINSTDFFDIWLLETGNSIPLKAKLVLPFEYKIAFYLKHIIRYYLVC